MGGVKALQFFDSFSGLALRISSPLLFLYLWGSIWALGRWQHREARRAFSRVLDLSPFSLYYSIILPLLFFLPFCFCYFIIIFYFFDGLSADIHFTDSLSNQKHSQREEKGGLSSTAPSDSEWEGWKILHLLGAWSRHLICSLTLLYCYPLVLKRVAV